MKPKRAKKKAAYYIIISIIAIIILLFIIKLATKPKVAAKVNDDIITVKELNYFYNRFKEQNPETDKNFVLNQLIANKVIVQEAINQDISVTKEEIDSVIMNTEDFYQKDIGELSNEQDITPDDLKIKIREQLLMKRFLDKEISVSITDEELASFYDRNKNQFKLKKAVNVSHILLNTEEEAFEVKSELESGKNFYELAKSKSQDPTAKQNNGNIGIVEEKQTVKEFEDIVFKLKKGEVGGPFKTTYGYHIVLIEDVVEERELSFDEVKDKLKEFLTEERKKQAYADLVRKLVNKAQIKKYV